MRDIRIPSRVLFAAAFVCGCERDPVRVESPPPDPPASQNALVEALADAYGRMDLDRYASLFPPDVDAPFRFLTYDWYPGGERYWGCDEELTIHRRMFEPENRLPGEPPVAPELSLQGITITLARVGEWVERPELYATPGDSTGLDSARWRATEARYRANVLWNTKSEIDYRIDGIQVFIVIEDLARPAGEARKFLLYRWEDLGRPGSATASESASWSQVKSLYTK